MLTHYLLSLQDRLHLGDAEFADELGLDPETWQALRAKRAPYSPAILARLLLHVPNAHALALEELRLHDQLPTLTLVQRAEVAAASLADQVSDVTREAPAFAYAA